MALTPLHKHTGRLAWDRWLFGRLFLAVRLAEDPDVPLLLRCWSTQSHEGRHQRDHYLGIERVTHEYEDGHVQRLWHLLFGPLAVWIGYRTAEEVQKDEPTGDDQ